jgi:hypothetical protein
MTAVVPDQGVRAWAAALTDAVNSENRESVNCGASRTFSLLQEAPADLRADVAPALQDFQRHLDAPLHELRSDRVANTFVVPDEPRHVLLVARMTVPGGPWPGHYGIESLLFDARPARFPSWFPPVEEPFALHFGTLRMASDGFARGSGCVVFPEQLSVVEKPTGSSFGVVFLSKLTELFAEGALPLLAESALPRKWRDADELSNIRELAFLAHEWGHVVVAPEPALVVARRRRGVAVLSEVHADLAAINLLLSQGTDEAAAAAVVLICDRIMREAWLPRAASQVDAIAARQLLAWLLSSNAALLEQSGQLRINVDAVHSAVQLQLTTAREAERTSTYDDPAPAIDFLVSHGWTVQGKEFVRRFDDEVVVRLERNALRSGQSAY